MATEAAAAIETPANLWGKGSARATVCPAAPNTEVRVNCRNCGYLDTADAAFCSECGQRP
ncbi:MAG TPA: hypothetical protein VJP06_07295 [Thermoplasmata archaeon]|nr:hypothetical protein [Thermoplasmata archaeon]